MKKILLFILIIIVLSGCSFTNDTPKKITEELFKNYQTLAKDVNDQLDMITENQISLTDQQKTKYKKIIEKQYKNLTYEIKDERIDGEEAIVTVEIEVYNYYKALEEASKKLDNFTNNGQLDNNKYNDYRIKRLEDIKERIKYTIDVYLNKEEDKWLVDNFTEIEREKIHGIYGY